jgi:hypothetical protein
MVSDVGAWMEASFLHRFVEFASPLLLSARLDVVAGLVLNCGLSNWAHIPQMEADLVGEGPHNVCRSPRKGE